MQDVFVYQGLRTPFGKVGGALAGQRPDDLAALVISELVAQAPGLTPENAGEVVGEVVFGNANGAGEENRNVARMAWLLAKLPVHVPATTINRLCGSSLDAAISGARQIALGETDVILAGGVESMSRAPWVLPKTERPFPMANLELANTTLGWRLINERMPKEWTVSLGEATEQLRERHGIGRERQDAFAARSHELAARAWAQGHLADLTVAVPGVDLDTDETIRAGVTSEKLAGLRTVFRSENGTVTAGNASPMNDGASAVWLGSAAGGEKLGLTPQVRIAGWAAAANEPQYFGYAPVDASNKALARAGIGWAEVGAVELNEAFAAQSLACLDAWDIDPEIVNAWGGAIAIGHPLGASGTRVLATLAKRMQLSGERWGVATLCIGVGQGLAVVLENATTHPTQN
ncbi:beta-ketoadipyl CoA thiolase [Nesterenkonia sp. AN1]|uniref:thiolase family protein n=1 Tax=Nesterenkonia sp. AN1 TaxID=652017 RepID=UPI00044C0257|nr:thiolase family protein [Nesterenkonia sp. AN1]EXF24168.1 beta-ketoadipyl CoA thiolase [Nesterenkonia sp. AN1]